jgi:hypothetical protein
VTPPSVRFLGRKVYLGAVVVIVSAMRHGLSRFRLEELHERFGVSPETVKRWRTFWRETFVESRFWQGARGLLAAPVDPAELPLSLLERFIGDAEERVVAMLGFVAPITTTSAGNRAIGEGRT